jgi:Spy/CpxP family protein refolding chaperone
MLNTLFLCLSLVLLTACTSSKIAREEVNQDLAETTVKDPKALGQTIEELINTSKLLTPKQKNQLQEIFAANKNRAQQLAEQSFKVRAVLVEELLSGKIDRRKVSLLKREIKKIESERLKNTFDAIEKVSSIVSTHPDRSKFAEHLKGVERMSIR